MRIERNARRRLAYALLKAMDASCGRPMRWGVDDCCLFQADLERAALGRDPAGPWRGRYRSRRGALRLLGRGRLPLALKGAARRCGWRRVPPARAKVGDIGLVETLGVLGVVRKLRRDVWVGRNETAYSVRVTADVRIAWSVL